MFDTSVPAGVYARVFHQGYSAAFKGIDICPYDQDTADYQDWYTGHITCIRYQLYLQAEEAERLRVADERAAMKAAKQQRHKQNKATRADANRQRASRK